MNTYPDYFPDLRISSHTWYLNVFGIFSDVFCGSFPKTRRFPDFMSPWRLAAPSRNLLRFNQWQCSQWQCPNQWLFPNPWWSPSQWLLRCTEDASQTTHPPYPCYHTLCALGIGKNCKQAHLHARCIKVCLPIAHTHTQRDFILRSS